MTAIDFHCISFSYFGSQLATVNCLVTNKKATHTGLGVSKLWQIFHFLGEVNSPFKLFFVK